MPNRNIAPRITPLSTPSLLPYQCLILANGTEIFYLNDPLQEVFKIDVVFEAGIYYQSQPLVASTTVNMLNKAHCTIQQKQSPTSSTITGPMWISVVA